MKIIIISLSFYEDIRFFLLDCGDTEFCCMVKSTSVCGTIVRNAWWSHWKFSFVELPLVVWSNPVFFLVIDRFSSVVDDSFLTDTFDCCCCCMIPFDNRVGLRWWRFRCDWDKGCCIDVSIIFGLVLVSSWWWCMDVPRSSSDDDK